jgi:tetratricopeptide (TPR) repeat protein
MTHNPPCRLWEVGTWRERRLIGGLGHCFSPDGRQLVVQDASRVLRLVETQTGRTLARLESPDLCPANWATFSPDGSRLVVTTDEGPAVHVWDLRAIRRRLVDLRLDWDAPAYSADDPTGPAAPLLPPPQVDFGHLAAHLQHHSEPPATLVERYTARLRDDPDDADARHHRAHALTSLGRYPEALDDLAQAIRLRPNDAHVRAMRGALHLDLGQFEPAIVDLEAALALQPDFPVVAGWLAQGCNNRAWELADGPGHRRDLDRALALGRRAVTLSPGEAGPLNTLGVLQYRAGRYEEALASLEGSLAAGSGLSDGFDLFFLAMAHHRLGHPGDARTCFDRGLRWLGDQHGLNERDFKDLAGFRAEAESVLAGPVGELPDDVFADPR